MHEALAVPPPGAANASVDLVVDGMSCAACVGRVERALASVPGVAQASVNLATSQARVRLDAAAAPPLDALLRAVAEAGYGARPKDAAAGAGEGGARSRWHGFLPVALALALAAPLVAPMAAAPFGLHWMLPPWLQALLAAPVQFVLGARFYRAAWAQLRHGAAGMDVLVALGTTAGYALSLWLWLGRGHGADGHAPHLYFEASAVVIALVLLGKWLEERARREAGAAIRALERLRPEQAHLLRGRGQAPVDVPVGSLRAGDRLAIRPGERVPADAVVLEGESALDESLLTGEPLPVAKAPGAAIAAGAVNGAGHLVVEVRAAGADTLLAGIIRMVEDAQAAKPPIQRLVDRVAAVFVPVVLALALATLGGWLLLADAGLEAALVHAVTVLVIACPCALGLATPAAIITGSGAAARAGILVRDAAVFEHAGRVRAVAFDKTGTLTEGRPRLLDAWTAPPAAAGGAENGAGDGAARAAALACALQAASEHPLARALQDGVGALAARAPRAHVERAQALAGRGIEGLVALENDGGGATVFEVCIASPAHAETRLPHSAWPDDLRARVRDWSARGQTLALLLARAGDGGAPWRALALYAFGDAVKPGAAQAVAELKARGLRVLMLSGDHEAAARRVAQQLGIDEVHAGLLPQHKLERLAQLRAALRQHDAQAAVAMAGDGVNDAPALAAADLGIAFAPAGTTAGGGAAASAAMHAAGITLLRADPRLVPAALDIGTRTLASIRQNLAFAFGYNVVGLPLAMAGAVGPVFAGAAMAASSVSVMANALRLSRWRP
jgi:Cu+-exporting ATPase